MISNLERELAKRIPEIECPDDCFECCSDSWQMHYYPNGRFEVDNCGITKGCSLQGSDRKCTRYEDRPFICRFIFKAEAPYPACPIGLRPKRPLTQVESEKMVEIWLWLCDNSGYSSSRNGRIGIDKIN